MGGRAVRHRIVNRAPQLGTGRLSGSFRKVWHAIARLNPVPNRLLSPQMTTGGVTWKPTEAFFAKLQGSAGFKLVTVATTAERTVSCYDLGGSGSNVFDVTKPDELLSKADTRNDTSNADNWHPSQTTVATRPSGPSFNYANEHVRWRIIHKTMSLGTGGASIDYIKQLERLHPYYVAGDTLVVVDDGGGGWLDINAAGRRWSPFWEWESVKYLNGPVSGEFTEDDFRLWPIASKQDASQVYGGAPNWFSKTDFSELDIY